MAMFRLGSAGQKRFLNFIYNEIKASQQCGALVLRFVSWYTIYCKSVKRLRYTLFTVPICAPLTKKQSTGLFFYTFVPPWGSSPFFIQIKKFTHLLVYELFWCERRDLNPYGVIHTPLKRARLPIPPLSHIIVSTSVIIADIILKVNTFLLFFILDFYI